MSAPATSLSIRPECAGDEDAVRRLVTAAFLGAAHRSGTEAAIVGALREAGALACALVAEDAGELVGHVAFSPVRIEGEMGGWLGLGPLAVRPDRQRRGIGAALVTEGLARLRNAGAHGCVVLGDPAYYGRFGFASDAALRYADVPAAWFQRLSFDGSAPSGMVRYHEGFATR